MNYFLLIVLAMMPILSFAHGDEDHTKPSEKKVERPMINDHNEHQQEDTKEQIIFDKVILQNVNEDYLKKVKPIFTNKCFSCHSSSEPLPWYSKVPIVGDIVKGDRKEGLTHLDLTNNFPFGGHGGPRDDIVAIQKSVEKDSMPPLLYKAFHWRSGLTDEEKSQINAWIVNSLQQLNTPKGGNR